MWSAISFSGWVLLAYVLGSLCAAIVVCRLFGLPDPRQHGSGNPGATNVLRLGGKLPALLTFVLDAGKGIPALLLAQHAGFSSAWLGWIALAAVLGHIYPVFLRFQGGKGVATVFGVLLALNWQVGLLALLTWGLVFASVRISSLASLCSLVLVMPVASFWLLPHASPALLLMALLVLWRHRQNIADLRAGKERGFRPPASTERP